MYASLYVSYLLIRTGTNTPLQQYVKCMQRYVIGEHTGKGSKHFGMLRGILVTFVGDDFLGGVLSSSPPGWSYQVARRSGIGFG